MKTIALTLYEYDELNPKAQAKARDWYRSGNDDNSFADSVIEDAEQIAALIGIEFAKHDVELVSGKKRQEPSVFWNGFSSQGDGACFEGNWRASSVKSGAVKEYAPQDEKLHRIASEFERLALAFPEASFSVKHSGHYSHENCTEFTIDLTGESAVSLSECGEKAANDAERVLMNAARDFMRWIYRQLEKEYEYQNSDAQIAETIRINEYTFTADGKRFEA